MRNDAVGCRLACSCGARMLRWVEAEEAGAAGGPRSDAIASMLSAAAVVALGARWTRAASTR